MLVDDNDRTGIENKRRPKNTIILYGDGGEDDVNMYHLTEHRAMNKREKTGKV